MRLFIFFTLLVSTALSAAEIRDFNKELLKGVNKDVKDEANDKFRKTTPSRGPASVAAPEIETNLQEDNKIEKMNIKQLGPSKW